MINSFVSDVLYDKTKGLVIAKFKFMDCPADRIFRIPDNDNLRLLMALILSFLKSKQGRFTKKKVSHINDIYQTHVLLIIDMQQVIHIFWASAGFFVLYQILFIDNIGRDFIKSRQNTIRITICKV